MKITLLFVLVLGARARKQDEAQGQLRARRGKGPSHPKAWGSCCGRAHGGKAVVGNKNGARMIGDGAWALLKPKLGTTGYPDDMEREAYSPRCHPIVMRPPARPLTNTDWRTRYDYLDEDWKPSCTPCVGNVFVSDEWCKQNQVCLYSLLGNKCVDIPPPAEGTLSAARR